MRDLEAKLSASANLVSIRLRKVKEASQIVRGAALRSHRNARDDFFDIERSGVTDLVDKIWSGKIKEHAVFKSNNECFSRFGDQKLEILKCSRHLHLW